MRLIGPLFAAVLSAAPALAEDAKPLTVKQCLEALTGLNSLNFIGQMNPQQSAPADPKFYKFPIAGVRTTIALDIGDLGREQAAAQKGQQDFEKSLGPPPTAMPDHGTSDEMNVRAKKLNENWQSILDSPCHVTPGRINESDLNIGDPPDKNPFPPSVLSVIMPLVDRK